jgi:peptidoglycan/xylan/chitin deacetylase (PgdA/CDA1 family)
MPATFALWILLLALDAGIDGGAIGDAIDAGNIDGASDAGSIDGASAPSPAAVPTTSPTPVSAKPVAIAGVTTKEPVIALTFDACATRKQANGFDRPVFDILARDKIPATLYLSGRWVETHPRAAKLIAAADFIELGNHTYSHPRLTLLRQERMHFQIARTNEIIRQKMGRPALTMRPPAGAWDATVLKAATEEHVPLVLWTIVSGDVGGHVPVARMVRTVLEQAKPGAIIIFHINKRAPFTKTALPDIVTGLRKKGFRFITVSQLLALPDAVPVAAKPSHFGYGMRKKLPLPEHQPSGKDHADPPT